MLVRLLRHVPLSVLTMLARLSARVVADVFEVYADRAEGVRRERAHIDEASGSAARVYDCMAAVDGRGPDVVDDEGLLLP